MQRQQQQQQSIQTGRKSYGAEKGGRYDHDDAADAGDEGQILRVRRRFR